MKKEKESQVAEVSQITQEGGHGALNGETLKSPRERGCETEKSANPIVKKGQDLSQLEDTLVRGLGVAVDSLLGAEIGGVPLEQARVSERVVEGGQGGSIVGVDDCPDTWKNRKKKQKNEKKKRREENGQEKCLHVTLTSSIHSIQSCM